jgi:isoamylase
LLVLLNAHHEQVPFALPEAKAEHHWERILDTASAGEDSLYTEASQQYPLQGRSLVVFRTRLRDESGSAVSELSAEALRKDARPPVPPREKVAFG